MELIIWTDLIAAPTLLKLNKTTTLNCTKAFKVITQGHLNISSRDWEFTGALKLKNWSITYLSLAYPPLTHPPSEKERATPPFCLCPMVGPIQVQRAGIIWWVLPHCCHFHPHLEHNPVWDHWLSLQQRLFRKAPTSIASATEGHTASRRVC